jgi:hypothetical protein
MITALIEKWVYRISTLHEASGMKGIIIVRGVEVLRANK